MKDRLFLDPIMKIALIISHSSWFPIHSLLIHLAPLMHLAQSVMLITSDSQPRVTQHTHTRH